jgi:glucose/mannose transport system substrate-binding protein
MHMRTRALIVSWILLLVGCGSSHPTANLTAETKNLEIMSWWVSASEHPALAVLIDAYKNAHPDVTVEGDTIAGGGGSGAIMALSERLRKGSPPDVWQTFVGSPVRAYAADGRTADLSSVAGTRELIDAIPEVLSRAITDNGRVLAVPTGAHRGNMLWFNRHALSEAGITPPAEDYPKTQFLADLAALKSKGKTPLCIGGKDRFATSELFENILLGEVGPDGWERIGNDRFNWNSEPVRSALSTYGTVTGYATSDYRSVTWSEAAGKLAAGDCAFVTMNDSFYGELVADGAKEGVDFGYVPFPGTNSAYIAISDAFVISSVTQNGKNAADFITTVSAGPTELEFARIKGGVPIRRDVDVASLPPYQQQASKSLWNGRVVLSMTHGELLSGSFQQALYNSLDNFAKNHNANAVMNNLSKSLTVPVVGP